MVVAALALPFALSPLDGGGAHRHPVLTGVVLVLLSVVNVEISRALSGGLAHTQQPHKTLSAWAFACSLLLPSPWLLVVVPLTYAHARWRGLRVTLWKWIGSAAFLVLAGLAAIAVRSATMGEQYNWMLGHGGAGIASMLAAAATFLAVETLLFAGSAWLGPAEDEAWLRQTLRGRSFYLTEASVILTGGLLAAVWTGGAWFILLFLPVYALAQRAVLHEPLRVRAEAAVELAEQNRQLEAANQFKADLMGILAHEIGNPLTAVLLQVNLAVDDLEDAPAVDREQMLATVRAVERNALQISRVLNDLLVLGSSENDALVAHPEPTQLQPLLTAAASSQAGAARPRVECPPDLWALVQPTHLEQIVANLMTNATKYAGGATAITAVPLGTDRVEIKVSDNGPGVAEAFRPALFDKFSRDVRSARNARGTGLGLFITRSLARANGGDVSYRPAVPHGSHFVLTLPQPNRVDTGAA